MLTNYHTHTTFCDGNDTVEQMALCAMEKGFDALGFSGHGFTASDNSYCMKDTEGYRAAVRAVGMKYADKIQIYLGVEEDMCHPVNREEFDYIIGSSHYVTKDGVNYAVDSGPDYYDRCVRVFDGDPLKMAQSYYSTFCEYILRRKPDIVGHFDLITKYDELNENVLLESNEYLDLAKQYMTKALESNCIFEVNTGAIARGIRTTPYPCVELLHLMKKHGTKLILSSDCHSRQLLDCHFSEIKQLLRDIGFRQLFVLYDGQFQNTEI